MTKNDIDKKFSASAQNTIPIIKSKATDSFVVTDFIRP